MPYRYCYWIILMMISCSFYMSMFQPASHYKSLLMTSDIPLHPKLKLVTKTSTITASTVWLHFLMALPMLHIIQTGSYAAYLTIVELWPSRKPPYWIYLKPNPTINIASGIEKHCYLVALVSGLAGTKPIPFSVNAKPICIDSGASGHHIK